MLQNSAHLQALTWKFKFIGPNQILEFIIPRSTWGGYTVLPLFVLPSVQDIFRHIFLSNYWWQKSDIWSQTSYRYAILWEAFLNLSDSYFLFDDLVGFYTHWTYMWGYHKWSLAHSSSCFYIVLNKNKKNSGPSKVLTVLCRRTAVHHEEFPSREVTSLIRPPFHWRWGGLIIGELLHQAKEVFHHIQIIYYKYMYMLITA